MIRSSARKMWDVRCEGVLREWKEDAPLIPDSGEARFLISALQSIDKERRNDGLA